MISTIDLTSRLDGGVGGRQMPVKPLPQTSAPSLAARPVTEPAAAEKGRPQDEAASDEKGAKEERAHVREEVAKRPDPVVEKLVNEALTRMAATRQAAERFFLSAATHAPQAKGEGVDSGVEVPGDGRGRLDTVV